MNPADHLGIWLAILASSTAAAAWNISRLRIVRPAIERLVALLGAGAIVAVVTGASVVFTEVTECAFAASTLDCTASELLLVAATDLALCAALITRWLRSDACRPSREPPRTRRHRTVTLSNRAAR